MNERYIIRVILLSHFTSFFQLSRAYSHFTCPLRLQSDLLLTDHIDTLF